MDLEPGTLTVVLEGAMRRRISNTCVGYRVDASSAAQAMPYALVEVGPMYGLTSHQAPQGSPLRPLWHQSFQFQVVDEIAAFVTLFAPCSEGEGDTQLGSAMVSLLPVRRYGSHRVVANVYNFWCQKYPEAEVQLELVFVPSRAAARPGVAIVPPLPGPLPAPLPTTDEPPHQAQHPPQHQALAVPARAAAGAGAGTGAGASPRHLAAGAPLPPSSSSEPQRAEQQHRGNLQHRQYHQHHQPLSMVDRGFNRPAQLLPPPPHHDDSSLRSTCTPVGHPIVAQRYVTQEWVFEQHGRGATAPTEAAQQQQAGGRPMEEQQHQQQQQGQQRQQHQRQQGQGEEEEMGGHQQGDRLVRQHLPPQGTSLQYHLAEQQQQQQQQQLPARMSAPNLAVLKDLTEFGPAIAPRHRLPAQIHQLQPPVPQPWSPDQGDHYMSAPLPMLASTLMPRTAVYFSESGCGMPTGQEVGPATARALPLTAMHSVPTHQEVPMVTTSLTEAQPPGAMGTMLLPRLGALGSAQQPVTAAALEVPYPPPPPAAGPPYHPAEGYRGGMGEEDMRAALGPYLPGPARLGLLNGDGPKALRDSIGPYQAGAGTAPAPAVRHQLDSINGGWSSEPSGHDRPLHPFLALPPFDANLGRHLDPKLTAESLRRLDERNRPGQPRYGVDTNVRKLQGGLGGVEVHRPAVHPPRHLVGADVQGAPLPTPFRIASAQEAVNSPSGTDGPAGGKQDLREAAVAAGQWGMLAAPAPDLAPALPALAMVDLAPAEASAAMGLAPAAVEAAQAVEAAGGDMDMEGQPIVRPARKTRANVSGVNRERSISSLSLSQTKHTSQGGFKRSSWPYFPRSRS